MATLTLATVRTNAYTEIYNLLQTGTYTITSNNIHPNFNQNQLTKEGYPQVIIKEPRTSRKKITLDARYSGAQAIYRVPISIEIEIYHNSSANAKAVADEVDNKIISGREVLRAAGMFNVEFEEDDVQDIEFTKLHTDYIYTLRYSATFLSKG